MPRQSRFSIIEIFIAIAIVLIMAAVAQPMLHHARAEHVGSLVSQIFR